MTASSRRRVQVDYTGDVQGVGFRYTVYHIADALGVAGTVENRNDGSVRLIAEGSEQALNQLLLQIRTSRVADYIESTAVQWGTAHGLSGFAIR